LALVENPASLFAPILVETDAQGSPQASPLALVVDKYFNQGPKLANSLEQDSCKVLARAEKEVYRIQT
jgi:hypothetical protein